MIQRSIQTYQRPAVIVRSGGDVRGEGHWGFKLERRGEAIEVSGGLDGDVQVPLSSSVKVYAGKSADVHNIQGSAAIYLERVHARFAPDSRRQ